MIKELFILTSLIWNSSKNVYLDLSSFLNAPKLYEISNQKEYYADKLDYKHGINLSSFDVDLNYIYKPESIGINIKNAPLNKEIIFKWKVYKENKVIKETEYSFINEDNRQKRIYLSFPLTSFIKEDLRYLFCIASKALNLNVVVSDLKLMISPSLLFNDQNKKLFSPTRFKIDPHRGLTTLYGDNFSLININSSIDIEEYGCFDFNELNIKIEGFLSPALINEWGPLRFLLYNNINVEQSNISFYKDNYYSYYELEHTVVNEEYISLKMPQRLYVNLTNNYMKPNWGFNHTKTDKFYFPNDQFEIFKESEWVLYGSGLGALGASFYFPFKVNFVKENKKSDFKVIGSIDKNNEEEVQLEEISL